ncbi:MAG: N-acetylglucosamine-6-phosphate deacetylase [Candidatus Thermoplasmatota archaeon]
MGFSLLENKVVKMVNLLLKNAHILTPFKSIDEGFVVVKNKKINFIGKKSEYVEYSDEKNMQEIDLHGKYLIPGFFDIHNHGAAGFIYDEIENVNQFEKICKMLTSEGITTFLPTLLPISKKESLSEFLKRLKNISTIIDEKTHGANPFGLNLELFLRPGYGAITSNKIKPTIENWNLIKKQTSDKVKIVTIAPCWENALELIQKLKMDNVIPSIGHTIASEKQLDKAIRYGSKLITHLFNGTIQPEQKQKGVITPGVNEYLLTRNDIMAEIIADKEGIHVHPTMLKIAIRCLGIDNIISITDSLQTRGTKINKFKLNGETVLRKNDVNYDSKGNLCGSALQLNKAVRNLTIHTKIELKDAVKTATVNPAKLLNVFRKKGSIEVGKDADLTVIDEEFNVFLTLVEGKIQFKRKI